MLFVLLNNKQNTVPDSRKPAFFKAACWPPPLQHIHKQLAFDLETKCFIYADDFCVISQHLTFSTVKKLLSNAQKMVYSITMQKFLKAKRSKT